MWTSKKRAFFERKIDIVLLGVYFVPLKRKFSEIFWLARESRGLQQNLMIRWWKKPSVCEIIVFVWICCQKNRFGSLINTKKLNLILFNNAWLDVRYILGKRFENLDKLKILFREVYWENRQDYHQRNLGQDSVMDFFIDQNCFN